MYTGKEVCQGCNKPGSEVSRFEKNILCNSCRDFIRLGKAELTHKEVKYITVYQHYHAYRNSETNSFLHAILKVLDNPTVYGIGRVSIRESTGSNGKTYQINEKFLEPLREFFRELDIKFTNVSEVVGKIPSEVRLQVSVEKTRIYNEGVEKGRELLLQLNSGGITMNDFEKNLNYKG
jgi:hypothetical protein